MEVVFNGLWPRGLRHGSMFGFIWTRGLVCVYGQPPRIGMFRGRFGPHGELFFVLLLKKDLTILNELIEFGPCVSADRVKACALIGLHMMAEENALRADGDSSPEPGDNVEVWLSKKSLVWSGGGIDWAGSEGTCSFGEYEHNVDNLALEVNGQNWSGEMVGLFLEDWELGTAALSCHVAMDLLFQEMRDACWVSSESLGAPSSL